MQSRLAFPYSSARNPMHRVGFPKYTKECNHSARLIYPPSLFCIFRLFKKSYRPGLNGFHSQTSLSSRAISGNGKRKSGRMFRKINRNPPTPHATLGNGEALVDLSLYHDAVHVGKPERVLTAVMAAPPPLSPPPPLVLAPTDPALLL